MSKRYFGTDGIRGKANTFPMTAEVAMKVGMAAGMAFRRGEHRHRVVIGKDTRLSGYMTPKPQNPTIKSLIMPERITR